MSAGPMLRKPLLGGTDERCNLVAACAQCNLAKGPRTAVEFVSAGIR